MNVKFIFVFCLVSSVLTVAGAGAAEDPISKARKLGNKNSTYAQIVKAYEEFRNSEECVTNGHFRAGVDLLAVDACRCPPWTQLRRWDPRLRQRIPAIVQRDLDDAAVPFDDKASLAAKLAEYYAGESCYGEAEATIRKVMALKCAHKPPADYRLWIALANVYRWQDRFEDAWKAFEKAAEFNPGDAARAASALAKVDGHYERVDAIADRIKDVGSRLSTLRACSRNTDAARKLALEYVRDRKARPDSRFVAYADWFLFDRSAEGRQALEAIRDIDRTKASCGWSVVAWNGQLVQRYSRGDWEKVEEIFTIFGGAKDLATPQRQRMRIFALAADGKREKALEVIATNLVSTALKPMDRAKLEISRALLTGGDVEKVIAAADVEQKDRLELTLTAARQALVWGYGDVAERLSAKYVSNFVDFPQRTMKVAYSKTPIESIADWRKLRGGLDRQLCDRKFGFNLDDLVTDVATGRKAVEKTEHDSQDVQMEISAVCDTKGLHLFLCVEDPNARLVESGFAGGMGNELYFAAGKYEPYICFGTNPRTGVDFCFQTSYDSKSHRRVFLKGPENRVNRFDSSFTDTDYVQHIFLAWDSFYLKMPQNGTKWRFECIAFGPKGTFSLGGSEGMHNSSKWCDLEFQLAKDDVTAIRRAMLYRHAKGWANVGRLDRFDKWADVEIGDPEFYNEVLKPLEAELKGYAKEVKPDMSDADVNRVFEKALPRWMGLSHEIDELRREWLVERNCR